MKILKYLSYFLVYQLLPMIFVFIWSDVLGITPIVAKALLWTSIWGIPIGILFGIIYVKSTGKGMEL